MRSKIVHKGTIFVVLTKGCTFDCSHAFKSPIGDLARHRRDGASAAWALPRPLEHITSENLVLQDIFATLVGTDRLTLLGIILESGVTPQLKI